MALAERTWERVGECKRDQARLIESAAYIIITETSLIYAHNSTNIIMLVYAC